MDMNVILESVPKFASFHHWFIKNKPGVFDVYRTSDGEYIGGITLTGQFVDNGPADSTDTAREAIRTAVELEFANFQLRPEWYVSEYKVPVGATIEDLKTAYQMTMIGVALMRARKGAVVDVDQHAEKLGRVFDWLESAGFYVGPSSTQYHDAFPGGNLFHHMTAIDYIKELWTLPTFYTRVRIEDAVFVTSVHDWCKIDAYESYTKKLPNPKTGNWEPTTCYKYKDNLMPLGHGVSSMFLASKFFRMSNAEALAIRWHMGAYRCVESETHEMYQAVEKYPLVLMLQFADQLATTNYPAGV